MGNRESLLHLVVRVVEVGSSDCLLRVLKRAMLSFVMMKGRLYSAKSRLEYPVHCGALLPSTVGSQSLVVWVAQGSQSQSEWKSVAFVMKSIHSCSATSSINLTDFSKFFPPSPNFIEYDETKAPAVSPSTTSPQEDDL